MLTDTDSLKSTSPLHLASTLCNTSLCTLPRILYNSLVHTITIVSNKSNSSAYVISKFSQVSWRSSHINFSLQDIQQNRDRVTRGAVESVREGAQRCIAQRVEARWSRDVDINLSVLLNMNGRKSMLRFLANGSVEGIWNKSDSKNQCNSAMHWRILKI